MGLLDDMFQNAPASQWGTPGAQPNPPGLLFNDRFAPAQNATEFGTFAQGAGMKPPPGGLLSPPPSPSVTSPQPTTSTTNAEGQPIGPQGLPVNAKPAQYSPPPAAPASGGTPDIPPTSLAGRLSAGAPGITDRLMAGIMGLTQSKGPVQGIGQMIGGLVSGQRQDPQGLQQAGMAQAYKSLVAAGVNPHQAMAAIAGMQAGDPSLMHATSEQFGLPKVAQTGEGILGDKQFAVPGGTALNPQMQTPQTLTPAQAALAKQPEAFQRQMFFKGQGTVYQGADGHVLKRGADGRVIDQMTGQEVRG